MNEAIRMPVCVGADPFLLRFRWRRGNFGRVNLEGIETCLVTSGGVGRRGLGNEGRGMGEDRPMVKGLRIARA
jgi:hypothetical protein